MFGNMSSVSGISMPGNMSHFLQANFKPGIPSFIASRVHRVACPKFGHPAINLESKDYARNTKFLPAL